MLHLIFGYPSKALRTHRNYIGSRFLDKKCMLDEFSKRVVKEIDKTETITSGAFYSPVLGDISLRDLSGGAQFLIILNNTNEIVPLEFLGDNCFPFLKEIADRKDITVCSGGVRNLFKNGGFTEIHIVNDDTIITEPLDLLWKCNELEQIDFGEYSIKNRISYYEAMGMV